jgi:hypothetical protein
VLLTDPDADPGGPKTYGSCGSGSGTLVIRKATKLRFCIEKDCSVFTVYDEAGG